MVNHRGSPLTYPSSSRGLPGSLPPCGGGSIISAGRRQRCWNPYEKLPQKRKKGIPDDGVANLNLVLCFAAALGHHVTFASNISSTCQIPLIILLLSGW